VSGFCSLEGKQALVTGGSRGIGKAIALGLAEDGADIAINYRRDEESARDTVAEIEKLGRRAVAYAASIDDFAQCETMVTAARADFGHIDILVNNAGNATRGQTVADSDPAELERTMRTHAFGAWSTRAAPWSPRVRPRRSSWATARSVCG
jgi:3-oxoacyl-[acyl-carrier protein] reductase